MKEALPAHQKEHKWGDCADKFVDVRMHGNAPIKQLYAAFHTDNKPMSLLCTFGTIKEPAVPQIRNRLCRDSDGVLQNFVGTLRQPGSDPLYTNKFNGVDNLNKLALGPGSCVRLNTALEVVRVFFACVAMADTNAFLAYQQVNNLNSSQYSHSDWRPDLVEELLAECVRPKGVRVRQTTQTGVDHGHKVSIPEEYGPHWWNKDKMVHEICGHCGDPCYKECICGVSVCYAEPCMLWHIKTSGKTNLKRPRRHIATS